MMQDKYGFPPGHELGTTLHRITQLHQDVVKEMGADDQWDQKPDDVLIDWHTRLGTFVIKATPFSKFLKDDVLIALSTERMIHRVLSDRNVVSP